MNLKEGDYIEHLHVCSTHDYMLFFTNQGRVYRLKVYELPEGSRAAKGRALVNVLPLKEKEQVTAVIPTRDFSEGKFLVFGTANGMVKKTQFKEYDTAIKAAGLVAIKIRKGDELVQVRMSSGKDDIIMVSKSGHAVRFKEQQARPMGRGTAGVKGMNVSDKGNRVLSLDVVGSKDKSGELLVVTENGYGKRTLIAEYPVKGRGTKGVLTIKLTAKKGQLAGALIVREQNELVFISQTGMVQRTTAGEISQQGRATQGVRVMNLKAKDRVSAVALVVENAPNGNGAARSAPSLEKQAAGAEIAAEAAEAEAAGNGKAEVKVGAGATVDGAAADEAEPEAPKAKPKRRSRAASKPKKSAGTRKAAAAKPKAKPEGRSRSPRRPRRERPRSRSRRASPSSTPARSGAPPARRPGARQQRRSASRRGYAVGK